MEQVPYEFPSDEQTAQYLAMDHPARLRNIRDHLASGRFGQREVWEEELEQSAAEIERLQGVKRRSLAIADERAIEAVKARAENERLRAERDRFQAAAVELKRICVDLRAALEPFANFNTEDFPDAMRAFADEPGLTMGHFRVAKNALSDEQSQREHK